VLLAAEGLPRHGVLPARALLPFQQPFQRFAPRLRSEIFDLLELADQALASPLLPGHPRQILVPPGGDPKLIGPAEYSFNEPILINENRERPSRVPVPAACRSTGPRPVVAHPRSPIHPNEGVRGPNLEQGSRRSSLDLDPAELIVIYLVTCRPLIATRHGITAARRHGLPPFVDASCRREPDFENPRPSISAICRGRNFAPRLRVGDLAVYLTVKGRYPGLAEPHWRLVAVLEVVERFPSHGGSCRLVPRPRPPAAEQLHRCGERAGFPRPDCWVLHLRGRGSPSHVCLRMGTTLPGAQPALGRLPKQPDKVSS
jgi:hypothetical protein